MKQVNKKFEFKDLPTNYEGLVRILPPRPIEDKVAFKNAYELIEIMAGHDLSKDQTDYLEALSVFIDIYEDMTSDLGKKKISPLSALKYLLDENRMNASDLGRLLGNRALGSAILRGERSLSKTHISKLSKRFKVSADLFLE
ncbi:MAG: helix-turn-helix domain-containing protein [Planctomycetota bacterium]